MRCVGATACSFPATGAVSGRCALRERPRRIRIVFSFDANVPPMNHHANLKPDAAHADALAGSRLPWLPTEVMAVRIGGFAVLK